MKKIIPFLLLLFAFSCRNIEEPTTVVEPSFGPEKGTLLIIGGAAKDPVFLELFKEYAGGEDANIIVVPTASDDEQLKKDSANLRLLATFQAAGFKNIHVLHTRDTAVANSEEFIAPIKKASGIYFMGGRQWRIADAFLNTKAHEEFNNLLQRGGIIAGSSAGATIQGSYLARGDTKSNTIMMGDHLEGLGFMKNVAIDQHILARNRQFDLFEIIDQHPNLLGIGLDENTGIVVTHKQFKVVGNHYVAIIDGTRWSRERDTIYQLKPNSREFYFLKSGDTYDLENRKVILNQN
ncbi:MAG: cyanophycinase [Bacteroidales bacterium]|nr:cyanophycinase [Bacteroidales bacterium]